MSKSFVSDWKANTEGCDPLPDAEVTETNIPGLHEVTVTVATHPVAEGRIASGLGVGHPTHQ